MLKKGLIPIIIILTVLTSFMVCNAESQRLATASINNETRVLDIEGSGWSVPYTKVAVEIIKPQADISTITDPNEVFIHIDQIKVGLDGTFTYSCTLPAGAPSGRYTLRLYGYGDANITVKDLEFTNMPNRAATIQNMQGATKDGVKTILDSSLADLDIDTAEKYDEFSNAEKLYVAGVLHGNMSDNYDAILTAINDGVKKVEILNTIQEDTRTNAKKALDDNISFLGITDADALMIYGDSKYTDNVVVAFIAATQNKENKDITPDMLPQIFIDVCDSVKAGVDEANKNNNNTTPGKNNNNKGNNGGFTFGGGSGASKDAPINTVAQERFADMVGFEWAKNAVYKLTEKGIINGKSNQNFCPGDQITREEFAKLIYVAFNIDPRDKDVTFGDVDKDEWYYDYVGALTQKGIVNGVSKTEFGVGLPISRQDMATILYRTIEKEKYDFPVIRDEAVLKDMDKADDYAKDAIIMLNRCNAVNGNEMQMFNPQSYTTRAEAAQMLYNVLYVLNVL